MNDIVCIRIWIGAFLLLSFSYLQGQTLRYNSIYGGASWIYFSHWSASWYKPLQTQYKIGAIRNITPHIFVGVEKERVRAFQAAAWQEFSVGDIMDREYSYTHYQIGYTHCLGCTKLCRY